MKNTDEVRTFASVVIAFDSNGKVIWDQSVKLQEIDKPSLDQVSDFYYNNSELTFLYKKESDIMVKKIEVENDSPIEFVEKIKLKDPIEEVRNENEFEGGVKQWTGNTFYVWGYQTIRNAHLKDEDRVRDVFYINKVVIR